MPLFVKSDQEQVLLALGCRGKDTVDVTNVRNTLFLLQLSSGTPESSEEPSTVQDAVETAEPQGSIVTGSRQPVSDSNSPWASRAVSWLSAWSLAMSLLRFAFSVRRSLFLASRSAIFASAAAMALSLESTRWRSVVTVAALDVASRSAPHQVGLTEQSRQPWQDDAVNQSANQPAG